MIAYLRLLIKDRLMAWNPASRQRAGQPKWKAVLGYAGYCVLALMLYGMLVAAEVLVYNAFETLGEPRTVLALVFLLCSALTLLMGFMYVLSTLFFSKDVAFVSALPISSRNLLMAKMTMVTLSEAGIALGVCLPVILLYGVRQGMTVGYYLRALLIVPFVPMIPLAVVTLLSFLLTRLSALWKRREGLTVVFTFVLLGLYFWFVIRMSSSASDSDSMSAVILQFVLKQKQLLDMLAGLYPPVGWIVTGVATGLSGVGMWLLFVGVSAAAMALIVLLFGNSYQRLAIRQDETRTRMNASVKRRRGGEKTYTPFAALYRREVKEIFTVPAYTINSLSTAVVMPMMALIMYFSMRENAPEFTQAAALLQLVPRPLIRALLGACLAFTCCMNVAVGSAVSREGKRHDFYKMLPISGQTQMKAKLCMGLTMDAISAAPFLILLLVALPMLAGDILLALIPGALFGCLSCTFSLIMDGAHPRFGWKTETEAIKQNTNSVIGMFAAMAAVAALGFGYYGMMQLGCSHDLAFLCVCAALALANIGALYHLFGRTAKNYLLQEVSI